MKQLVILALAVIISAPADSQDSIAIKPVTKETYLKKSQNQTLTGWVLVGTGVGAMIGTGILDWVANKDDMYPFSNNEPYQSFAALYVISGAIIAAGVICLVSGAANKKKAAAMVHLKMEPSPVPCKTAITRSFPAAAITISL